MNLVELKALAAAGAGPYKWGPRSLAHLAEVHPDLQRVFLRAIELSPLDLAIVDGRRTVEEQRTNVANGASKTMNSRHLTGHAVDVVPVVDGKVSWHWPHYRVIRPAIIQAFTECGVPYRSGSNWDQDQNWEELGENDGPHWELPRSAYP